MPLTFEPAGTHGEPSTINVLSSGRIVGRIVRAADGKYRFYKGGGGMGMLLLEHPLVENTDLEALEEWLRTQHLGSEGETER